MLFIFIKNKFIKKHNIFFINGNMNDVPLTAMEINYISICYSMK